MRAVPTTARGALPPPPLKPGARPLKTGAGEPAVAVRELLSPEAEPLSLRLAAGRAGLERMVLMSRVQRPGLALTGYTDYIRYGRVQIMGGSEVGYLRKLARRKRSAHSSASRCWS